MSWTEQASEALARAAEGSAALAPIAAFLGGALTALNPCVLAMVPLMIGVTAGLAGRSIEGAPRRRVWPRTLGYSLVFVAGFSLELVLLFVMAGPLVGLLGAAWWKYVLGAICALLGVHLLGLLHVPSVPVPQRLTRTAGLAGVLLLGFMFGLVSLPCTGPVLLLLVGLVPQVGAGRAGTLLFLYGLGHCLLLIAVGTSVGLAGKLINATRLNNAARRLRQGAGVLVLVAAAWLVLW